MRQARVIFVLRLAVILTVLMVGLFFTGAAITRANFFSETPTETNPDANSPAEHANAN
ncbi:MAG TPA: hypothetical protein VF786_11300 [Terriglobales bacterium]